MSGADALPMIVSMLRSYQELHSCRCCMGCSQHVNQILHRAFLHRDIPHHQTIPYSCIRCISFGNSVRCRSSRQYLLALQPHCQILGCFSAWNMWKFCRLSSGSQHLQSSHRPDHYPLTSTDDLVASDVETEKN